MDPIPGNTAEPLSLHKYAYCHGNPVTYSDPTGMFSLSEELNVQSIQSMLMNFSGLVSKVQRAFSIANSVMNAIDMATTILGLVQGGFPAFVQQAEKMVSKAAFGEYAYRFTLNGIREALSVLAENMPRVMAGVLGSGKAAQIATALAGPSPAIIIWLPTPPGRNIFAGLPPVKILNRLAE